MITYLLKDLSFFPFFFELQIALTAVLFCSLIFHVQFSPRHPPVVTLVFQPIHNSAGQSLCSTANLDTNLTRLVEPSSAASLDSVQATCLRWRTRAVTNLAAFLLRGGSEECRTHAISAVAAVADPDA